MGLRAPMTEKAAAKAGYSVTRGAYSGTTDDRLDRWYLQAEDGPVDRRGAGFATKKEALLHLGFILQEQR